MSIVRSPAAPSPRTVAGSAALFAVCLAISSALHLSVAVPWVAWSWATFELDSPGDEGPEDAPVGNGGGELLSVATPVRISVYQPSRSKRAPKAAPVETPPPEEVVEAEVVAVEPSPEASPQGEAHKLGVAGKPPRGKKKPCEAVEEIVQLGDTKWRVERDMVDWYATHLRELEKQAGVGTHKGPDGKPDGARLYLPRCSVLKQAGLRNGDIVHSVNGRKATNIPQAVTTYLAVRNDKVLKVEITRRNGDKLTHTYRLK